MQTASCYIAAKLDGLDNNNGFSQAIAVSILFISSKTKNNFPCPDMFTGLHGASSFKEAFRNNAREIEREKKKKKKTKKKLRQ